MSVKLVKEIELPNKFLNIFKKVCFSDKFTKFVAQLIYMNIGKALKEARQKTGLKQMEVAEKAGISQTYLCQIEGGDKTPSIDVITSLTKVYKLPIAVIMWKAMDDTDVPQRKKSIYNSLRHNIDDMINRIFYN